MASFPIHRPVTTLALACCLPSWTLRFFYSFGLSIPWFLNRMAPLSWLCCYVFPSLHRYLLRDLLPFFTFCQQVFFATLEDTIFLIDFGIAYIRIIDLWHPIGMDSSHAEIDSSTTCLSGLRSYSEIVDVNNQSLFNANQRSEQRNTMSHEDILILPCVACDLF